jgi:hypothetical protein
MPKNCLLLKDGQQLRLKHVRAFIKKYKNVLQQVGFKFYVFKTTWNHQTDLISTSICGAGTTKRSVVPVQPKDNHEWPKDVSLQCYSN